jgi:hypothetical protein
MRVRRIFGIGWWARWRRAGRATRGRRCLGSRCQHRRRLRLKKADLRLLPCVGRWTCPVPVIRASSDRQIAAVHCYRAAGYPARLVGGQKQHRADEVVGLAESAERDRRLRACPPSSGSSFAVYLPYAAPFTTDLASILLIMLASPTGFETDVAAVRGRFPLRSHRSRHQVLGPLRSCCQIRTGARVEEGRGERRRINGGSDEELRRKGGFRP